MNRSLRLLLLCVVSSLLWPCNAAAALQDTYSADRKRFLEARTALNRGQLSRYRKLAARLQDYPLHQHLQYWEIRRRLSRQDNQDIQSFVDRDPDSALAAKLRRRWLYHLARNQRWPEFLAMYQPPQGVELQCYALQARLKTGDRDGLLEQALPLWLVGRSQPSACDPVFDLLSASALMTPERIWQRIRLAMDKRKLGLAGFLAKKLSAADRNWVRLWQAMHRRPAKTLKDPTLKEDLPIVREILRHGLRRLVRNHPEEAWAHWDRLAPQYRFDTEEAAQLERSMALSAAYQHHPRALEWLRRVPTSATDDNVLIWRIRAALGTNRWQDILTATAQLSDAEKQEPEWRYWRAQALYGQNRRVDAMQLIGELARERHYYGFLAADFLQWQYAMNDAAISAEAGELQTLEQRPGLLRAHELYQAGLIVDARREWLHETKRMTARELQLAARLAQDWGWHDRAILTVAKADHFSDLSLRFPLAYREQVEQTSKRYRLDPALIFGVIRQESAFMQDARSSAGALGLMQLMPSTGRNTARAERIRLSSNRSLLQSDKNISIGSAYLKRMLDRFDHSPVLATAAYNAGPHRVKRWRPEQNQSAAVWVERIPFKETRRYVRNILAYAAIFEWRMQQPITRLEQRMPEVAGADQP